MKLQRLWLALVLVVSATFLGVVAGAFAGGYLWPSGGAGWDAMANALGGAVLGGGFALAVALLSSLRLKTNTMRRVAAWTLGVAVVVLVILMLRSNMQDTLGERPSIIT